MHIIIIPGFLGFPEETLYQGIDEPFTSKGHKVSKIGWPHFPDDLSKYNFTNTLTHARSIIDENPKDDLVILGFSMGGIIATVLATEYKPKLLGLIITPYQAGTGDDLAGKYKEWQETGYREITSSKYGVLIIPFSFIADAQKYNALELISEITCPTLFVAGEKDTKVPPELCRKLFDNANEPKEWHLVPGMEHKYKYQPEILPKVNEFIINFIERYS